MTTEVANLLAPDDEYRKQVLTRYEARHKSLTSRFSILVIFGLGFLAFILVPLIAFKLDADRVARELAAKTLTIETLQNENAGFHADQDRLQHERDLLNGKLTSLEFVRVQKEEEARAAQEEIAAREGELAEIETRTAELRQRLERLQATQERMEKTLSRFEPSERVAAFREWFLDMADRSEQDVSCADDDWQRYYACMVRQKLQLHWDEDFTVVREEVVTPLLAIESAAARSIEEELLQVREAFEASLEANPDFWRTIDQKLVFMEQLAEQWDRAFETVQAIATDRVADIRRTAGPLEQELDRLAEAQTTLKEQLATLAAEQTEIAAELEEGFAQAEEFERQQAAIERQADENRQALAENQSQLASLKDRRSEIELQQAAIEARIKDFESPFGKLPLGLSEAVLAFPFIIAAWFLVCALMLAELIGLRREYHAQVRAIFPGDPDTVRHRVAVLASAVARSRAAVLAQHGRLGVVFTPGRDLPCRRLADHKRLAATAARRPVRSFPTAVLWRPLRCRRPTPRLRDFAYCRRIAKISPGRG